jgi:hypothetical protein
MKQLLSLLLDFGREHTRLCSVDHSFRAVNETDITFGKLWSEGEIIVEFDNGVPTGDEASIILITLREIVEFHVIEGRRKAFVQAQVLLIPQNR